MMAENHHITDIAIIGAGPVGLFAVFEAGMLKCKCHVIDALDFVGGQCTALYPEKPIYDIAGFPAIEATKLIENLKEQAAPFAPVYHLGQRVERVARMSDVRCQMSEKAPSSDICHPSSGWRIQTSRGITIDCRAILIAAGCGAFGPNRPPIEGIEGYEGKSVFYSVVRKEDFRDKRIVIAGGGDSAVDWILALADIAKHISVIHRRPKFRCAPESADKMKKLADAGKIEMVIPYQLEGLQGKNGMLEKVIVKDLDNNKREIVADNLLAFFGLSMELGPIAEWGLNLDFNHIKVNPVTLETSQTGIFAIGDIAKYPGKLKLIACGFSEAAMAAHAIYPLVHPDEALHFEYSTTKGVPG